MSLTIKQNILTNNDCYKATRARTDTNSVEVHSIGTAQNSASALASYWNQSGIQACVHYCVDAETEGLVYQFLPESKRAWADGGYGNNNSITFEIMESDYMKYTSGANYTITNQTKFIQDIIRGYNTAVLLTAKICKEHSWSPQEKMSNGLYRVYSHNEARILGLATSHVDPSHIWDKINKTMDTFRAEVAAAMGSTSTSVTDSYYRVRKSWADSTSQLGAYTSLDNAKANCPTGYSVFDSTGKAVYTAEVKAVSVSNMVATDLNGLTEANKIAKVAPIYQQVQKETEMLASVGLAQFCLESGYGTTDLAQNANNMHGMKCSLSGNSWSGSTWDGTSKYTKKTAEQTSSGSIYYVTADFRKYDSILNSVRDRAAYFIGAKNGNSLRYPNIATITDAETQVKLIKSGGYATDTQYVTKLMKLINQYNLTQYDLKITSTSTTKPSASKDTAASASTTVYRVQVGVYSTTTALNSASKKIKSSLGYSCFTEKQSNGTHLYCGSFTSKENAERRISELKAEGFSAILKTK